MENIAHLVPMTQQGALYFLLSEAPGINPELAGWCDLVCFGRATGSGSGREGCEQPMTKKVIRNLDNGLFACENGLWIMNGRLAQDFPDGEAAMVVVEKWGIKNAELVSVDDQGCITSRNALRIST